jgi:hypothetical protein
MTFPPFPRLLPTLNEHVHDDIPGDGRDGPLQPLGYERILYVPQRGTLSWPTSVLLILRERYRLVVRWSTLNLVLPKDVIAESVGGIAD